MADSPSCRPENFGVVGSCRRCAREWHVPDQSTSAQLPSTAILVGCARLCTSQVGFVLAQKGIHSFWHSLSSPCPDGHIRQPRIHRRFTTLTTDMGTDLDNLLLTKVSRSCRVLQLCTSGRRMNIRAVGTTARVGVMSRRRCCCAGCSECGRAHRYALV